MSLAPQMGLFLTYKGEKNYREGIYFLIVKVVELGVLGSFGKKSPVNYLRQKGTDAQVFYSF